MNTDRRFHRVPKSIEDELALNAQLRRRKCARCGHPSDWHRVDDADPSNYGPPGTWKTRCIGYDCEAAGTPVKNGCNCPDFVEADKEEKQYERIGH